MVTKNDHKKDLNVVTNCLNCLPKLYTYENYVDESHFDHKKALQKCILILLLIHKFK